MIARLVAGLALVGLLTGCIYGVPTDVSVVTYPVTGTTFDALKHSWTINGPRIGEDPDGAFASVLPAFKSNFVPVQQGDRCIFSPKGEVYLDAEVTLPKWQEQSVAPPEVRLRWDVYASYAVIHEGEHIKISQKYARRLKSYLRNASAKDCDLLLRRMHRDTQQILEAHYAEQQWFDETDPPRFDEYRMRYLNRLFRTTNPS